MHYLLADLKFKVYLIKLTVFRQVKLVILRKVLCRHFVTGISVAMVDVIGKLLAGF
jgi:hypothetical protein